MRDAGHREKVELALALERSETTPVNNFSNSTATRSAGYRIADLRWDATLSARVALRFSELTHSDFVKPALDNQAMFLDLGVSVKQPDDNYGRVVDDLCKTPEDVDRLALYDPFEPRQCPKFTAAFVDKIAMVNRTMEEDYVICGFSWGPFSAAGYLRGVEALLMDTYQDPGLIHKLVKKAAAWTGRIQQRFAEAGATVFWMADPTASEDMISKDMFKEYVFDPYAAMVRDMKRAYDLPFFLHICGDTVETMTVLPELGVDCFSVDAKVDIGVAKKLIGDKIAIHGNVHPIQTMLNGSPADVTRDSMMCIEKAGLDGGFILAPGCDTPRDTPDANVIALGDAGTDFWNKRK
ncbi:MAG: uroporphyrinogen decarboxylase family protein [Methanomassiliicoccus sp.]|nr:uroporphyrinogen decarboxylase family protein [Methanomassiliicoccus sp.]